MKKILATLTLLLALGLVAAPAQAQVSFELGPRVGYDAGDVEELFIGADVRVSSAALPLIINPTFDYYFIEDVGDVDNGLWALSVNALYPFGVSNAVFTPYGGAGVGLYNFSFGDSSTTDVGLNLVFGAQFLNTGVVKPFVEAQYSPIFSDPENTNLFTVKGGLLFGF